MMTQVALIQLVSIQEVIMSEQEIKRGLRLVRYGGVVVTVAVLTSLVAFAMMTGNAIGGLFGGRFQLTFSYIFLVYVFNSLIFLFFFFFFFAFFFSLGQNSSIS